MDTDAIAKANITEAEYERQIMVRHLRVGCYLVITLMPFGFILDYAYYYAERWHFLIFRLACSILLAGIPALLRTDFGRRNCQALGVVVALLPAFFICWMIRETEGAGSPYYAGLNLILLAIAFVLRWGAGLSLLTLVLILIMYMGACLLHGFADAGPERQQMISEFANNLYFLGLTGVIVVTGSRIHQQLRIREKALSQQLARSKAELERTNQKLAGTIQELHTAQDKLVQAEKQKSLGLLAGGIIHNIGNTLNHVRTNLFSLRKKTALIPPEHAASIQRISDDLEAGIKQAMGTVQQVRIYTHPDTVLQEQIKVKELVDSAVLFTESAWREAGIQMEQDLMPDLLIWGNKQSLVDVLVNLILNSVEALRAKSFPNGEPATIRIEGVKGGERSLIRVRDNGSGVDPAICDRIFDPYFTTKDIGRGTGLGLSTSKRTVEQYGGQITLRTELGKFTEFTLDFPAEGLE
jgi:C4-dicarboxylate-specific signal transduction histidine kinase